MFYGWWIVVLAFVATAYGGATVWYGFTAFFDPLIEEFAWSYTAISLAASLRGVEFGLMDIVVGFLVDRFSIRRIILVGSILIGIGWLILSRVNSLATFYMSFFIICTGATGISSVVFLSLITRWFYKRLGLALGLTMAGFGAGGFAVPGIVYLLDVVGFRMVFFVFGVTALIIGGFTAYFLRDRPQDMGCGPDGVPLYQGKYTSEHASIHSVEPTAPARDYTFKEAISKPAFWIVTYVSTILVFSLMMVSTHVMPYLEHLGYSRHTASIVAMMIPVMSITGRLGIGWVSDFISRRLILILTLIGGTVGIMLFLYAHLFFFLISFVLLFGISYGGIIVLRPGILREYYGSTYIGSIIGLCFAVSMVGSIIGPTFAGWIFDTTSSYSIAWVVSGVLFLIGVPLVLIMKHPQVTEKKYA
ncbi:MFS transporter [Chloroflexota bacterium]